MPKIEADASERICYPLLPNLESDFVRKTSLHVIQRFLKIKMKTDVLDTLEPLYFFKEQLNWGYLKDPNALYDVFFGGDELLWQDPINNSRAIIICRQAISKIAISKKNDEREFSLVAPRVIPRGLSISGIKPDLQRILSIEYNLLNPKKELQAEQISISLKPEELNKTENPANEYQPLLTVVEIPEELEINSFIGPITPEMMRQTEQKSMIRAVKRDNDILNFIYRVKELNKVGFNITKDDTNYIFSFNPKDTNSLDLKSWEISVPKTL